MKCDTCASKKGWRTRWEAAREGQTHTTQHTLGVACKLHQNNAAMSQKVLAHSRPRAVPTWALTSQRRSRRHFILVRQHGASQTQVSWNSWNSWSALSLLTARIATLRPQSSIDMYNNDVGIYYSQSRSPEQLTLLATTWRMRRSSRASGAAPAASGPAQGGRVDCARPQRLPPPDDCDGSPRHLAPRARAA
jgi:hypothetical protein